MSGTIYCFNCISDPNIYKAGHTQQETLAARLRGYMGLSKPREIICSFPVADSERAEQLMLSLMRALRTLAQRRDLGVEWFEATSDDREERHSAIRLVMDVVAKAVQVVVPGAIQAKHAPPYPSQPDVIDAQASSSELPGMELYYVALERYVGCAPAEVLREGCEHIVRSFEESEQCPVFAEYTQWSFDARCASATARLGIIEG